MDFKSLRSDKLKLTQEEFANLYGISIQEVQELDKTGKPDMDLIVKIATKSGLDFNTILSYEKPRVKPISAKDTWEKTNFTKKSLSGYLNSALEQMDIPDDMRKNYIDDLEIGIMSKFVKPTVAIVGRSDTGKSTLINSLIGAEKMPAKWTPTTSTAVYVKHIKDRPAFIHDEAWIFKRECGNEKFWNSKRLYDEKYCEKWKVAGGDLSLLETYSTRQGGGLKTEAGSAVVFVDAPILLNCDIIDLPGYGTETASDDVITAKTAAHADVLIYLSLASGFLRIEDIEYLKNNVRTLPVLEKKGENGLKPLANLFVVASHADSVDNGNEISLANILKSGCERYMSTLSDSYWKSRAEESGYDYSPAVIQSRFFTYAGYAFASSLAKIGIIGGLGAFLAADAAFAFGSWAFLFGIGGQIALFANFLGPIGIVAGALISAGLGIMKLFGGGWEKSVAKKLVNAYEEKGVTDQYRKAINEYWAQTETAFDQAAEQLDQAWTAYVERLQTTVDSYDIEQIETSLTAAKGIQNFFEHIPL